MAVFVLYGFICTKTHTTVFLFYNYTYLVIKIMIITCLYAEIKERQKSLAAILKNGSHFVFGTNLRWPYILTSLLGHIQSVCQISNSYHKMHNSLKFCIFLSHYIILVSFKDTLKASCQLI